MSLLVSSDIPDLYPLVSCIEKQSFSIPEEWQREINFLRKDSPVMCAVVRCLVNKWSNDLYQSGYFPSKNDITFSMKSNTLIMWKIKVFLKDICIFNGFGFPESVTKLALSNLKIKKYSYIGKFGNIILYSKIL